MSERLASVFGTRQDQEADGEHWLTISDLMAGLMMVFLFVSIALMRSALLERDTAQKQRDEFRVERDEFRVQRDKIRKVAVTYRENQQAIYDALVKEFTDDLDSWQATIDPEDLSFEFKSPEVLFAQGEIQLRQKFINILADFFPRYLDVLGAFESAIDEVRVEGHTSSEWTDAVTPDLAYFKNMELSQGRTRSVLAYVYGLEAVRPRKAWVKRHVAAVGFSSSRLVLNDDGAENLEASRRVAFRVITNAETQIRRILEE
jgi:outer membrane protein OmpA-like peptidoglycan-associated protein